MIAAKITNRNSFQQENVLSVGLLTISTYFMARLLCAGFVCFLTKLRT
jgi:hypothetical protein